MISTREEALKFINTLNAPEHLIKHVTLVGEVADLLIKQCESLELELDYEFIRVGVVIHDIGKIVHTQEMAGPGSQHEPEGQRILLENGVSEKIARCCLSHARWREMECSLEELLIALSDKLWKGKRVAELELKIIDRVANRLRKERWDIFSELDSHFELIAADGDARLNQSLY